MNLACVTGAMRAQPGVFRRASNNGHVPAQRGRAAEVTASVAFAYQNVAGVYVHQSTAIHTSGRVALPGTLCPGRQAHATAS